MDKDYTKQFAEFSTYSTRKRVDGLAPHTIEFLSYYLKEYMTGYPQAGKQTFMTFLSERNLALSTKATIAMGLGKFFYTIGVLSKDDFDIIKDSFRAPFKSWGTDTLEEEMVIKFIRLASKQERKFTQARDSLMIMFLGLIGCRANQLLSLKQGDVFVEGNDILIVNFLKQKENREGLEQSFDEKRIRLDVHLGEFCLRDMINIYLAERRNFTGNYFFVNRRGNKLTSQYLRWMIGSIGDVLNHPEVHPHSFRHYVGATVTKKHGIAKAAILLGHSNISTTQRYVNPNSIDTSDIIGM